MGRVEVADCSNWASKFQPARSRSAWSEIPTGRWGEPRRCCWATAAAGSRSRSPTCSCAPCPRSLSGRNRYLSKKSGLSSFHGTALGLLLGSYLLTSASARFLLCPSGTARSAALWSATPSASPSRWVSRSPRSVSNLCYIACIEYLGCSGF